MQTGGDELTMAVPGRLVEMVEKARREWLAAQNEFNSVTDPGLIDHAIYAMHAAERRYVYLIRLAARMESEQQPPVPTPSPAPGVPTAPERLVAPRAD